MCCLYLWVFNLNKGKVLNRKGSGSGAGGVCGKTGTVKLKVVFDRYYERKRNGD